MAICVLNKRPRISSLDVARRDLKQLHGLEQQNIVVFIICHTFRCLGRIPDAVGATASN